MFYNHRRQKWFHEQICQSIPGIYLRLRPSASHIWFRNWTFLCPVNHSRHFSFVWQYRTTFQECLSGDSDIDAEREHTSRNIPQFWFWTIFSGTVTVYVAYLLVSLLSKNATLINEISSNWYHFGTDISEFFLLNLIAANKLGHCWQVRPLFIWSIPTCPSTLGTFQLLAGLFCSQGQLVIRYYFSKISPLARLSSIDTSLVWPTVLRCLIMCRTLPTNAHQGFSSSFRVKTADLRHHRVFSKGD